MPRGRPDHPQQRLDFRDRHLQVPRGFRVDLPRKDVHSDAFQNNEYGVAMYATNLTGEIHFADVKLEAVSEGARKGSTSQLSLVAAPRLVPLQPLLNRIPRANPELTCKFYSLLPEKRETLRVPRRRRRQTRSPSRLSQLAKTARSASVSRGSPAVITR